MDFMKVLDQTVREIKREVNLKVLKVPEMEQKVLDATSDEPWGPHGTALTEISRATKKFTECQMVMNVLWTRLAERGPKWRHAYKALTIIEYLIANGSERAVDDILDHRTAISVLSSFEYVEPNGKDVGINVRKKVETIVGILSDQERIKAIREKAATNRDKYIGLSSTGITYKSSSTAYGGNYSSGDRYGSLSGSREADSFSDSYRDKEPVKEESHSSNTDKWNAGTKISKEVAHDSRNKDSSPSNSLKPPTYPNTTGDDFDDFDPRGSSTNGSANAKSNEVDLFGPNLIDDFMDEPTPTPPTNNAAEPQVDLFADADFQSAIPNTETATRPETQGNIDLFADQPIFAAAFSAHTQSPTQPSSAMSSETIPSIAKTVGSETFDPFAAIPLGSFEGSDPFGSFTSVPPPTHGSTGNLSTASRNLQSGSDVGAIVSNSNTKEAPTDPFDLSSSSSLEKTAQTPSASSKSSTKKETFQVKSGIWSDSLSRGLIDLNITTPKKVNLADIGIVGGLGDGSDERDKGLSPWAMGAGSGMGMSGFSSSATTGGINSVSNLGQHQFGSFK